MRPATRPQNLLILLGSAGYPGLPTLGEAQAGPFMRSAEAMRDYFKTRMGVRDVLDLFDQPMSASEQIKWMKEYLQSAASGSRVFIYYIGHGILIPGAGGASEYVLACRDTSHEAKLGTAITVAALGEMLRSVAARLDVVMILDCCFAAMAFSALQVSCRSLSLFAASSRYKAAIAAPEAARTQFTDCVHKALAAGSSIHGERLSLQDLELLVREQLQKHYPDTRVDPELHAPKYGLGDPRGEPLFPNPAFQLESIAGAPAKQPIAAYLIVQIEPEKRRSARSRYQVKAWMLIEPEPEQYYGDMIWDTDSGNEGKPVPQGQLDHLLLALHKGAADWLLARDIYNPDFWIEMILPRELLNERFDQLAGANGPLGADHHFVVRSWERQRVAQSVAAMGPGRLKINLKPEAAARPGDTFGLTADALLRQQQRWDQLRRQERQLSAPFVEISGAVEPGRMNDGALGGWVRAHCPAGRPLWDRLVNEQGLGLVCVVMEQPPASSSAEVDSFFTMLRAGIPVVLWLRRATSQSSAVLLNLLSTQQLRRIPDQIRALRRAAAADATGGHYGSDLTLLWDNPNRLPTRVRLRAPETRR